MHTDFAQWPSWRISKLYAVFITSKLQHCNFHTRTAQDKPFHHKSAEYDQADEASSHYHNPQGFHSCQKVVLAQWSGPTLPARSILYIFIHLHYSGLNNTIQMQNVQLVKEHILEKFCYITFGWSRNFLQILRCRMSGKNNCCCTLLAVTGDTVGTSHLWSFAAMCREIDSRNLFWRTNILFLDVCQHWGTYVPTRQASNRFSQPANRQLGTPC